MRYLLKIYVTLLFLSVTFSLTGSIQSFGGFGNHLSTTYLSPDASGRLVEVSTKRYTGAGHYIATGQPLIHRFPGGYFSKGEAYGYITDYQGNITAVADASGRLVQQTDYYPYGEPWREPGGQPFLYSGNERLRVDGLNEYDFNARRYNSATTSFTTPDTRCEEYPWLSPYAFCAGNPIRFTDRTGQRIKVYDEEQVEWEYLKKDDCWNFYSKLDKNFDNNIILAALETIRTANTLGEKMIGDLVSAEKDIVLNITDGEDRFRFSGCDEKLNVFWNPLNLEAGIGIDKNGEYTRKRDPITALAHELAHSYEYIVPPRDNSFSIPPVKDFLESLHFNVPREEIIPCVMENSLRKSFGDPIRRSYYTVDKTSGFSIHLPSYLNFNGIDEFLFLQL